MSLDVDILFDTPAPETCPTTFAELVSELQSLVSGEVTTEIIPYIVGVDTPAAEDQDKVWERLDANGRPIGRYVFYDGNWRKEYTVGVGAIMLYNGDPALDFGETGGRGTIGGQFDGWQLCNGENGSPDLSDRFIVGAKMSDLAVGYPEGDGPWKTSVSGETTQSGDGVSEITLDADTTYQPSVASVVVGKHEATGNTPASDGPLYGSNLTYPLTIVPAVAGNTEPDAIPTLPKYYALALIVFIGYE